MPTSPHRQPWTALSPKERRTRAWLLSGYTISVSAALFGLGIAVSDAAAPAFFISGSVFAFIGLTYFPMLARDPDWATRVYMKWFAPVIFVAMAAAALAVGLHRRGR